MQIDKKYKVEKCCAKSDVRYTGGLQSPYLEGDKIIATNGHALVVVPVVRAGTDTDGPVPIEAIKASRKRDAGGLIACNGGCDIETPTGKMTFPRPENCQFPKWEKVMPTKAPEFTISFNAKLLHELAAAMGTDCVTLRIVDDSSGIDVRPDDSKVNVGNEARGVLMPRRT